MLNPSLARHIYPLLFSPSGSRQNHIGVAGNDIAVGAVVDYRGLFKPSSWQVIYAQQPEGVDVFVGDQRFQVGCVCPRMRAHEQIAHAGCRSGEAAIGETVGRSHVLRNRDEFGVVGRCRQIEHHRAIGTTPQLGGKRVGAFSQLLQFRRGCADLLDRVSRFHRLANVYGKQIVV